METLLDRAFKSYKELKKQDDEVSVRAKDVIAEFIEEYLTRYPEAY